METKAYKFWVYVVSDGKSNGLLIKRQNSANDTQECMYFHFAGGLSPTLEILNACGGHYAQLAGNLDEKRFVDGLIDYIIKDQAAGCTKKNHVISISVTDGQTFQVVMNHFFGRAESPLLDFFINANIFKQAVLSKIRNKDEYIGMAEEFGVLSPHNLTVNDLKYIRPIEKVLKAQEENKAKWFRKSGPLAIDFDNNLICTREKTLDYLRSMVTGNFGSILEGDMATGKTVLVRQLGYMLRKDGPVYYFDCDGQRDFDFEILAGQINNLLKGIFIFENVHLETQKFQLLFSRLQHDKAKHILFTTRLSLHETHTRRFEGIDALPKIELELFDDVDQIIDHFAQHHAKVPWSARIYGDIKNVSKNNFWLLSYALKGYVEAQGRGEPISWLKSEVIADLKELETIDAEAPNVVVALSALYQNEVLTCAKYLLGTLQFNTAILKKLAAAGEITKQVIDGNIFYGLPHSALAMAYWEHGIEYRNLLKYPDYEEFVYQYVISGAPNSFKIILTKDNPKLIDRLATEERALEIIQNLKESDTLSLSFFTSIIIKRFKLDDYYSSKQFVQGYADILFQKKQMNAVAILLKDHPMWASDIWKHIDSKIFSEYLFSQQGFFGLSLLSWIVKANRDLQPNIRELLKDISFDFELVPHQLSMLCSHLRDLYEIDVQAVKKEMDKLDIDILAEILHQEDISDYVEYQWRNEDNKQFFEIVDERYVFRNHYNIEFLLLFLRTYGFKNKTTEKLVSKLDISKLKRFADNCPAIVIMEFLLLIYKTDTNNKSQYKNILASNIKRYSDIFMVIPNVSNLYFDDQIYETDAEIGQKLYKNIYEQIGIEKYIDKIMGNASDELHNKCHKYLLSVDPEDKQGWKQFLSSPQAS
ncbi:MAG: hypothetical protein ACYC54_00350 [Sedimentisphaerales bacterium]